MGGGASGLAPDEPTFDAKAGQPAGEQLDQKQVMLGKKLLSKLAGPDEVDPDPFDDILLDDVA